MENYQSNLPNKTSYEEYIPFGQDFAVLAILLGIIIYAIKCQPLLSFAVLVIGLTYFLWCEHKAKQAEASSRAQRQRLPDALHRI